MEVDAQGNLRNLMTMTTIPLGHVDESDMDRALHDAYDKPLWKVLFEHKTFENDEVQLKTLFGPTGHWVEQRRTAGDIGTVDPDCELSLKAVVAIQQELVTAVAKQTESDQELMTFKRKLEGAAAAMLDLQLQRIGNKTSDLYKTHEKNIEVWKSQKLDVHLKAHLVLSDEVSRLNHSLDDALVELIERAHATFMAQKTCPDGDAVHAELLSELEAVLAIPDPKARVDQPTICMHIYTTYQLAVFYACG